jgi:hypothetical protein
MIQIAPSERNAGNAALEKRLWDAADPFRADSGIDSQEYSAPVLVLIFLRFAAKSESISVLSSKVSTLRRTSDMLLPRLLSGKVKLKTEAA